MEIFVNFSIFAPRLHFWRRPEQEELKTITMNGDETECKTNCKFVVFFYMNIYIYIHIYIYIDI